MAKTVYIVYDTDLEKIIGVFDNPESADDCENIAPGDRYTESFDVMKNYNDEEDPRNFNEDLNDLDEDGEEKVRSYDDDQFYETDDENEKDPYGD